MKGSFIECLVWTLMLIVFCDCGEARLLEDQSSPEEEKTWLKAFPTTRMPEFLHERLSGVDGLAARQFSAETSRGQLSAESCSDAKVLCYIDTELIDVVDSRHTGRGPSAQPNEYVHEQQLVNREEILLPDFQDKVPIAAFLPTSTIHQIPYGSKHFPAILRLFGYSPKSNMSRNMLGSLQECEADAPKGQRWVCARSMGTLVSFVSSVLPQGGELVTSSNTVGSKEAVRVLDAKLRYDGEAPPVSCHSFAFPHALFFCHYIQGTKIYTVTMQTKAGQISERTAICHAVSAITTTAPSMSSDEQDCHWIYGSHLLWIPRSQ